MKFKFKIQQYQTDAVENTVAVFRGQPSHTLSAYRRDLGTYKEKRFAYKDEEIGYGNHRLELDRQTDDTPEHPLDTEFIRYTPFGNTGPRGGTGKSGYRDGNRYGQDLCLYQDDV